MFQGFFDAQLPDPASKKILEYLTIVGEDSVEIIDYNLCEYEQGIKSELDGDFKESVLTVNNIPSALKGRVLGDARIFLCSGQLPLAHLSRGAPINQEALEQQLRNGGVTGIAFREAANRLEATVIFNDVDHEDKWWEDIEWLRACDWSPIGTIVEPTLNSIAAVTSSFRDYLRDLGSMEMDAFRETYHHTYEKLLTFSGSLGLRISPDGVVDEILEGQAKELGVEVGWQIRDIEGHEFAHLLLREKEVNEGSEFNVRFVKDWKRKTWTEKEPRHYRYLLDKRHRLVQEWFEGCAPQHFQLKGVFTRHGEAPSARSSGSSSASSEHPMSSPDATSDEERARWREFEEIVSLRAAENRR